MHQANHSTIHTRTWANINLPSQAVRAWSMSGKTWKDWSKQPDNGFKPFPMKATSYICPPT